uniref:Uncharacterized protein n=1 Tax=Glossina palpalis gambiensis TaxID=67801 RepID=A0A1B0BFA8_9MUSC
MEKRFHHLIRRLLRLLSNQPKAFQLSPRLRILPMLRWSGKKRQKSKVRLRNKGLLFSRRLKQHNQEKQTFFNVRVKQKELYTNKCLE